MFLVETIRVCDGGAKLLDLHQSRMDHSFQAVFGVRNRIRLTDIVDPDHGPLTKCRVVYNKTDVQVTCAPYTARLPGSYTFVDAESVDYAHKYEDREQIRELLDLRGDSDEIIMLRKGRITDASIYNLAFYRDGSWYTPEAPMLKGVMREALLERGVVKEVDMKVDDLSSYSHVVAFNAMNPFQPSQAVSTAFIH